MNLNKLKIITDDEPIDLTNNNLILNNPKFDSVEAIFRDLEENLLQKIKGYKKGIIFGSVAWLTSFKLLDELASCDNVQIVVQKEDFLRPDVNAVNKESWIGELRKKYNNLKFALDRYDLHYPINELSILSSPDVDPIRCLGNHNKEKKSAFPRAHNKFLVFCKFINEPNPENRKNRVEIYKPVAVWTGSFNLTQNAANSFENAIYMEDKSGENLIINSFLKEHHQLFALSEKLDWESDWVEPEFRIGT